MAVPDTFDEVTWIGLAEVASEYGLAAVLKRVTDLRAAGLADAAAAIEGEVPQLMRSFAPDSR